ncbi:MAG TPA: rhodanese-like domain-containing protein [Ruminococcaceae bacterium]|nr:rhodanese-like domain-containing protein [Oscillospiraceae bacterium]
MNFMDLFKRPDINAGIDEWKNNADAVLLDVRTVEEYQQGHIEGSQNIPLQNIEYVKDNITSLDKPIYVHCLSGSRSAQAVSVLKSMGYTDVTNIGGINAYRGKVVR